jgi:Ala-tRNA(Pro) deacylase
MSIAPTLQRYLTAANIQYDVIPHIPAMSSERTAEACRISGDRLAKAIVLRRGAATCSRSCQRRITFEFRI